MNVPQAVFSNAVVTAAASGGTEVVHHLIQQGADVNCEAEFLGTVTTLLVAAIASDALDGLQKAQLLIAHGAEMNAPAMGYSNALQMLLHCKVPYFALVECLLDAGMDTDAPSAPNGAGTSSEMAVQHYRQDEAQREAWKDIILLLRRNGAVFFEGDLDFLLQQTWFLDTLTADC
ncbi:hypothetical protein BU26DRAFT_514128, partial [Trematosphaeria pertusa]